MSLSEIHTIICRRDETNRLAGIYRGFSGIISVCTAGRKISWFTQRAAQYCIIYIYLSYCGGLTG